jgi:hypothetical protein
MSGVGDIQETIAGVGDAAGVTALRWERELPGDAAVGEIDAKHAARTAIALGIGALIRRDP